MKPSVLNDGQPHRSPEFLSDPGDFCSDPLEIARDLFVLGHGGATGEAEVYGGQAWGGGGFQGRESGGDPT
jgi:hypothetical protein